MKSVRRDSTNMKRLGLKKCGAKRNQLNYHGIKKKKNHFLMKNKFIYKISTTTV